MTSTNREPDWARVPPHVPTYPNPPAYFRQTPANRYTAQTGDKGYSTWWSKWHPARPVEWREEHYRTDPETPAMRKIAFEKGTLKPGHVASWEQPPWRQQYLRQGLPEAETVRARGLNRAYTVSNDKNVYQFSNAMTSTQYRKPVTGVYGPMLRQNVYGVNTQHNNHGFMNFQDLYF